ncbi:MAG: cell envelope integrity protein CreD [Thiothrix sp.]|nr:cell envelope integrity protein CreD [Thiothrix sp.]
MKPRRSYSLKLLFIILLVIGLLIPQASIMSLIGERQSWRYEAQSSIAQSWPGSQILAGPLLLVPYLLTYDVKEKVREKDGSEREIIRSAQTRDVLQLMPVELNIDSKLASNLRYRGIYPVPVFTSQLGLSGYFDTRPLQELQQEHKNKQLTLETPQLSVLVRDQRGVVTPPVLNWDGQELMLKPGSQLPEAASGMHARLPPLSPGQPRQLAFSFQLELRGMLELQYAPLAENTIINLVADWPHPKFSGALLPENRDISAQGFHASWRTSSISFNVNGALQQCRQGHCNGLMENTVGFELHQPVDVYQQSERSIKYAFLFIILTFTVMHLLELLKKLRIHPVQYLLVGLALCVFYLLLVSLSEHLSFRLAYLLATLAGTSLLTLYFSAILHSHKLGLLLGGSLLTLYGMLYLILQAEDQALLMGSLLIFALLSTVMLGTRHMNWYALTGTDSSNHAPQD